VKPSSQDHRTEYIAGLRELANWLKQNPGIDVPSSADILLPLTKNDVVEAQAAAASLDVRYDSGGNASATIEFGPIIYRAYGYADWDQHYAQQKEKRARDWANENDMVIQPREGGAA
jgi:hypothetical protein